MKKIIINEKYYGKIELPETKNTYRIFNAIKKAFANKEDISLNTLYSKEKIKSFDNYQKGGAREELLELEMFIELSKLLGYSCDEAVKLKNKIEMTNDLAHSNFNITKRLVLLNKKTASKTDKKYLFWDIENFSNIGSVFSDVIEKYNIDDANIYLAANPDSLYLFKAQWEAELYDYGKTLNSFNFTKCDHGKNVADLVLLKSFKSLKLQNADIYLLTYDTELKELFKGKCSIKNNLYIMNK